MNHLAHVKLASPAPHLLVGHFLADDIKGRLHNQFTPGVERGIQLHRSIDAYTDTHPVVLNSYRRLDSEFRRYGGIITDIIFDHFLATDWNYHDCRPLGEFCQDSLQQVLAYDIKLPTAVLERVQRMKQSGAMEQYRDTAFIDRSFVYLSGKLKWKNPLPKAYSQFEAHGDALKADFNNFYPALSAFVADWIEKNES